MRLDLVKDVHRFFSYHKTREGAVEGQEMVTRADAAVSILAMAHFISVVFFPPLSSRQLAESGLMDLSFDRAAPGVPETSSGDVENLDFCAICPVWNVRQL